MREDEESKIALFFIITSTLKIILSSLFSRYFEKNQAQPLISRKNLAILKYVCLCCNGLLLCFALFHFQKSGKILNIFLHHSLIFTWLNSSQWCRLLPFTLYSISLAALKAALFKWMEWFLKPFGPPQKWMEWFQTNQKNKKKTLVHFKVKLLKWTESSPNPCTKLSVSEYLGCLARYRCVVRVRTVSTPFTVFVYLAWSIPAWKSLFHWTIRVGIV